MMTGSPASEMPAPTVTTPFQLMVSAAAFLKLSLMVAFLVTGAVTGAKLATWLSSAWLMQKMAFAGRSTRFCTVFFACFVLPCTVV